MSLLTICQGAARKLSIAVPSAITSATSNQDAMLLWELANEEGYALSRRATWPRLRKEHTFTTVAQDAQTNSIPSDMSYFIDETMFDRTQQREVDGPCSPQEWQEYKTGIAVSDTWFFFQRGDEFLLGPNPTAGLTFAYEYIATTWARSNTGAPQTEFLTDSDTHIFASDQLIKLGIIWRWRKQKGLAFEDEQLVYERAVVEDVLKVGGKMRINMNDRVGSMRR